MLQFLVNVIIVFTSGVCVKYLITYEDCFAVKFINNFAKNATKKRVIKFVFNQVLNFYYIVS